MRNKKGILLRINVFSFFLLLSFNQLFSQEKFNISVGAGFPEAINLGLRYQVGKAQLGISLGTIPAKDEKLFSVSGDVFYHFGGFSGLSERNPWYGRGGVNYTRDEKADFTDKLLYLNLRIGRDLNISRKIGIEIDAGMGFRIFGDITSGWDFPVIPGFGIVLFYRI